MKPYFDVKKSNIITQTAQNAANIENDVKVIAKNLAGKSRRQGQETHRDNGQGI